MTDYEYEYEYEDSVEEVEEVKKETTTFINSVITESYLFEGTKYFSMQKNEVIKMIYKKIEELSSILSLTVESTIILMIDHQWNEDKIYLHISEDSNLIDKYREIQYMNSDKLEEKRVDPSFTCNVCGINSPFEVFGMSCGHVFCKDCYYHHIQIKMNEGESLHLKCMQHDCSMRLLPDICIQLSFLDLYEKYCKNIIRNYLQYHTHIKCCLDSYCERFIVREEMIPYISHLTKIDRCKNTVNQLFVECPCSKRICFHCSNEDHYPITCQTLISWNDLDKSEGKTMDWLLTNTKRCPKCRMSIEKNQGCRHMKCRFCTHSFCWDCMHPWETNCGYSKACNGKMLEGYDRVAEDKVQKATLNLQYYMHYYKGFMSQKDAIKFSIRLKEKIIQKSIELSEFFGSLQETGEYLVEALNIVIQARNVLKYLYIYNFYLSENKELSEAMLGDLMNKTDYLTSLTEKKIQELDKAEIMDFSSRLKGDISHIHTIFQHKE